jgi:hypothetical protein
LVVAAIREKPVLKAQSKSSGATDATLPGVLALVRLLARDAAKAAFADQKNKRPAAREAVPAYAQEQKDGGDQRS